MELLSPKTIKELLEKHNTRPNKTMGQNFLIDAIALGKIAVAAALTKNDVVIEVGPGIGTLTRVLAEQAGKVISIEKDWHMLKILKETLVGLDNIEVISADALSFDAPNGNYKVVANIPYYLTSVLIRKFLEAKHQPNEMVLMVQKEVAQRICAKPPNMSLLAVSVQFYATPKIISYVSKGCFWPAPNVDSAILRIVPHSTYQATNPNAFFTMVKAGFSHPRKQLSGNLAHAFNKDKQEISEWLLKNSIDPMRRAETLSIQEWIKLTQTAI